MQDYEAAFRAYPTVAKAVMMSEVLHDSLRELCDQQGANTLFFSMSPEVRVLMLAAWRSACVVTAHALNPHVQCTP